MKKIEAVTVCVGYSHILKKVVENKDNFFRWTIVTIDSDIATKKLCREENLNFVTSRRSGLPKHFRKGCMINDGLDTLAKEDWILQIDCDILLPSFFKQIINEMNLNENFIYGCKRVNIYNEEEIDKNLLLKSRMREKTWGQNGCIMGYFQLFHSSVNDCYPEESQTCADDDVEFQLKWGKNNRRFLPFKVSHYGIPFDEEKWGGDVCKNKLIAYL